MLLCPPKCRQYYGFVEADNPNDAYVVNDFGSLISECSQSDKGAELFRRANIVQQLEEVPPPSLCQKRRASSPLPSSLPSCPPLVPSPLPDCIP